MKHRATTAKRLGRPMKYEEVLLELTDELPYSPGLITYFAQVTSLLDISEHSSQAEVRLAKLRIRMAMARFARNHNFPKGDALISIAGCKPVFAWFGWRWKAAIGRGKKRKKRDKN